MRHKESHYVQKLHKINLIFSLIKSNSFLKEKSISKEAKIDRQLSIIDVGTNRSAGGVWE